MDDGLKSVSVLFCCTGNICRSPTAEAVFRHQVDAASQIEGANLAQRIRIDSAGTHAYHIGHAPDHRSQAAAAVRGYQMDNLRARQIERLDFIKFDFVLAMDRMNIAELRRIAPDEQRYKPGLLMDFSATQSGLEVPDPYYGQLKDFERVLEVIEEGCAGLLRAIKKELGKTAKLPLIRAVSLRFQAASPPDDDILPVSTCWSGSSVTGFG